jgi:hypothetical protein
MQAQQTTGPAYWIFLPGLFVAVAFLCLIFRNGPQPLNFACAFAVLIPTLGGIILRSLNEQKAASVCAVIPTAAYWVPVLVLMIMLIWKPKLGLMMIIWHGLFLVPLGGFAFTATRSFSKTVGPRWATAGIIFGIALIVAARLLRS